MKKSIKSLFNSTRLLRMEALENRQLLDAASIFSNTTPDTLVVAATETTDDPVDLSDVTNDGENASQEETDTKLTVVAGENVNQYVVSWDAVEDAAAYRVKISKDGGETWLTYVKSTEDATFNANGLYKGKAWSYRVFTIDAGGRVSADYFAETTIAPVALADANLTYTDGDTISIALKGAKDADGNLLVSADTTWYEIDSDGAEIEITEAAGLFEYAPTSQRTVKVVATGVGFSSGSSAELTVTYTASPVVRLSDYAPANRTATVAWDVDPSEAVVGYNVKISKDGGTTWTTYRKISRDAEGGWTSDKEFVLDTDSDEFSVYANGLYVNREYVFRVYPIPEGSSNRNYNIVNFTPFGLEASVDSFEVGTPVSVSLKGAGSAEATYSWYYNSSSGLVAIAGSEGLDEITPEYANYDVVCVATGVGASAGEENSIAFTAEGSNVYLTGYDSSTHAAKISWEPMLDAASYRVQLSTDGGETYETYQEGVTDSVLEVQDIYGGQTYSFIVTGYDVNGQSIGTSQVGVISPCEFTVSPEAYNDDDAITVTLTSGEDSGAELYWYSMDADGNLVEIEEARGLTEYVPTGGIDVVVTAVGVGLAEGQTESAVVYYRNAPEEPSVVVNSLEDVVDSRDQIITLREAVEVYSVPGATITFDASLANGTITLNGTEITISSDLSIDASALYNSESNTPGVTIDGASASRAFLIQGDAENYSNVTFAGLKIQNTNATSGDGGAISAQNGYLTVVNSVFENNAATGNGGAISANDAIEVSIDGCIFTNNEATINGGAVAVEGSSLAITNSYFGSNTSGANGGAISASAGSSVVMKNDVVVGNTASGNGAGIAFSGDGATASNFQIENNTIANNVGAGVYNYKGTGAIVNSIVVGNASDVVTEEGSTTGKYVLASGASWNDSSEENIEYDSSIPLFNDDYTLVLSTGSQAINKGSNDLVTTEVDFLGNDRIVSRRVDLGAFEAEVEIASTVVTTTDDVVDITDGFISLREALTIYAEEGDVVTFDASLSGQTISLANKQIDVATSLTLDASALDAPITLNAGRHSRVFQISGANVVVDGVIFANGKSTGSGGAITATNSTVTIANSVFTGSQASGFGGAIYLNKGAVNLTNVLAYDNASTKGGAFVYAKAATLNAVNVTIADNVATAGAAVEGTTGAINLYNTIVARNEAPADVATTTGSVNAFNVLSSYANWSNAGAVSYVYDASAPLFNEDYTLSRTYGNQAIDKGDSQYVVAEYDLNGEARVKGNAVDLGVYEADVEDASTVVTTLEDVVNSTDYVVSLREALTVYASAGDTITFDSSLDGQTITLGGEQIVISKNVAIDASALANGITVSGGSTNRVFRITASDVVITGVDFAGGYRDGENGGTIYCATGAGLTLSDSTISGGYAVNGGALYASTNAALTLDGVTLSNNTATTQGGAIYLGSNATLSATNCTFSGNAGGARGGVFSAANGNTVNIANSSFTGNSATRGAAFYTTSSTNVTVSNSTVSNNAGTEKGGAIYSSATGTITLTDTTFTGNRGGAGAVITITNGTVNATNVEFTNNTSTGDGGALRTEGGVINVTGATLSGNAAVNGGAVAVAGGAMNLTNVRIASNRASGNGAAVYAATGAYSLVNALITGNNNGNYVVYTLSTANLVNITLAENSVLGIYSTGSTTLRNSIVWNNSASNIQTDGGVFTVNNVLTQSGRTSGSSAISGTFWESDKEEPYNSSFQLKTGWISEDGISPIDSGNNAYNSTSVDLAGNTRVVGSSIDLGPYEHQSSSSAVLDEIFADELDDLFED